MKTIFMIIFCCIAFSAKAQSIEKLVAQTEKYISVYDGLSPWIERYSIRDFKFIVQELSKSRKTELIKSGDIENDSISGWTLIETCQEMILANIDKIAHHKDFLQKGSGFFLLSPDNKLFNFRLYENTGGSYKSNISFVYYIENGEVVYEESIGKENRYTFFNTDGYYSIDTIQTDSCVKYLLQGSVIGCNTCFGQYMDLIHFENSEPLSDFSYELRSRFGSVEQFDYDAKTKTITVEYEEDDQNGEYYDYEKGCGDYHFEEYRFNGETFELIETHWKKCMEIFLNKENHY